MRTLNDYIKESHENNKQWWYDINTGERLERDEAELRMLIVTELAEAVEGMRKDKMDDKLAHRKMEEVELADALIRIFDYRGGFGLTMSGEVNSLTNCQDYLSRCGGSIEIRENKGAAILDIVKEIVEDSTYRAVLRILHYGFKHGLDLQSAYNEKTTFNLNRADHKAENRVKQGGKKF